MPKVETSKVAVVAKFAAAPGKRDQLIDALEGALANAESEAGTLMYILHEDSKEPDVVWFYEMYTDQDALTAHGSSDAFKAVGAAVGPFIGSRPEITYLKPVGGKGL
jgi:quinol monooxygenase YgiN